jgi:hypothetical protein
MRNKIIMGIGVLIFILLIARYLSSSNKNLLGENTDQKREATPPKTPQRTVQITREDGTIGMGFQTTTVDQFGVTKTVYQEIKAA